MANSSSRSGARVLWVVVHTAEGIRKASDLKSFFERSTNSSSHAVADDVTLLDNLVPYDRAAWTLRNGNSRSDNLELCGFASWSRAEWLNNHQGMLNNAAAWIRSRCLARGIPIRKIDAAAVGRNEAGVIGHVDYTNGKHDGSHWDPGPGFPWDVVIARAAQGGAASNPEDDMPLNDADKAWIAGQFKTNTGWWYDPRFRGNENYAQVIHAIAADAAAARQLLISKSSATATEIAEALKPGLAAAVLPSVQEAVKAALGADNEALAQDIVTKLGERIAQPSA